MRNPAFERDDSILPFTFLISIFFHGIFFFLNFFVPAHQPVQSVQWIYPEVTYRVFPGESYFSNYSKDEIFTRSEHGLTIPTTGDVRVAPDRLHPNPERELPIRGRENLEAPQSVANRVFLGEHTSQEMNRLQDQAAAEATNRRSGSYRASLTAPEAPEGILRPQDRFTEAQRFGSSVENNPSGSARGLRSGGVSRPEMPTSSSNGGYNRGVINVPSKPMTLEPTTPQSGRTMEHRPYTEPVSAGPLVDPNAPESARPGGEPNADGEGRIDYGPRRIIYKPLPEYPEWAERERVQASPKFYVTVGADGRVAKVRMAVSSGYNELDRLAEGSVRRWLYEPRPGRTEERRVIVQFVLRD